MGLFKKVDKVLAAFGNIRALERTHVDSYTENKIKIVKGKLFAESDYGQLFGEFNYLAGYNFWECTLISSTNFKTWNGGVLELELGKENLKLHTDNTEIESDYSNVSGRYMTALSFLLSKKELQLLQNHPIRKASFHCKKKILVLHETN